jgi:hypothetical protein
LSRGSSPSGYPAEPLVSYQINRQLSGWNLPPLVIRAFGAHCQVGLEFHDTDEEFVRGVITRRSGPLGAAIKIHIELPDG